MFKKTKKQLREYSFLKDKYKNVINLPEDKKCGFVSDQQIASISFLFPSGGKFNQQLLLLKSKPYIAIVDIFYMLIVMITLPLIIAGIAFSFIFKPEVVGWIVSLGGSFGVFMISAFLLVMLTSPIYSKLIGGKGHKEVNIKRAYIKYYAQIRNSPTINYVFYMILNNPDLISDNYRKRSGAEDEEKHYHDVKPENFTEIEKKVITSIFSDLEKDFFHEINENI